MERHRNLKVTFLPCDWLFFLFSPEVLFLSENGFARQRNQLAWERSMSMEGVLPRTIQPGRAFPCMENFLCFWHLFHHMVVVLRSMVGLDETLKAFSNLNYYTYWQLSPPSYSVGLSTLFGHIHSFILLFHSFIIIKIYSYQKKKRFLEFVLCLQTWKKYTHSYMCQSYK